jgi:Ig-like domain CHU_C associated/Bacterial Ig-like domain (group 2)
MTTLKLFVERRKQFLVSLMMFLLLNILFFSSKTFGQTTDAVPCNAHRWEGGDGWRLNDLPKGIVRCTSSAEEESIPKDVIHPYNSSSFTIQSDCFGSPNEGDDVIWMNFDVRPFAGSFQYQLGIGGGSTGELAWALYYSNAFTPGLNNNGLSGDCSDLTPSTCGVVESNGWQTLNVPKFPEPTNYYIAIWSTVGSVLDKNINFKARFGCGEIPISCILEKSLSASTACMGDGTYTACQDFVGCNGKWTLTDNAAVKASSYDVKTYALDGVTVIDHFTSTDLNTMPITYELTNLGSGGPIKATVCATYSTGNNFDISLTGSGISNPPANYTCTANESFSGTGLTTVTTPAATPTQPDCTTSTGTVQVTNYVDGVTYTLTKGGIVYTADNTGLFSGVVPGTYILSASLTGSCSSTGNNVLVNDAPATPDKPAATVVTQPNCTTSTGSVQVSNHVNGDTYTLTNGGTVYTADNTGLFSGVVPGTYIFVTENGSCSATGDNVIVDPQPAKPAAPAASGDVQCQQSPIQTLTATTTSGENIVWYDAAIGGNNVANPTLSSVGTVTFYAEAVGSNGCHSISRTEATLTINAAPAAPLANGVVQCQQSQLQTLTATATAPGGGSIVWYDAATGGNKVANLTLSSVGTVTYYAEAVSSNGCHSLSRTAATLTVNALPAITGTLSVCAGSTTQLAGSVTAASSNPWVSSAPLKATVSSTGLVTGVAAGTANITYTNSNGCSRTVTVTVNARIICATFNGDYFKNTASTTTGGTASVTLSYNISGAGTCNNIGGLAASDFIVTFSADPGIGSVTLGTKTYVSGILTIPATITLQNNAYSGTVQFTLSINNSNFTIGDCLDVPLVTVSTKAEGFVTGGGYIIPTNAGGSKGTTGVNGSKNNFGFNIKWNRALNKLQGNWNTIIRRIEGSVIHLYQVKSSQATSLVISQISATSSKAEITFSAVNLKDLKTGSASGGGTLNIIVYDNGEPGGGVDRIYFSVKDGANNLWYTTASDGTVDLLTKGNIQIHKLDVAAATTLATVSTQPAMIDIGVSKLSVSAYPNPFTDKVKFSIESPVSGKASLDIYNVMGQKLHTVYQGYLFAGTKQVIDYHVPSIYRGSLLYTLKVGNHQVTGKVIQIK